MRNVPTALVLSGLLVLAIAALYWVATGTQSFLFVVASLALIALGSYRSSQEQFLGEDD